MLETVTSMGKARRALCKLDGVCPEIKHHLEKLREAIGEVTRENRAGFEHCKDVLTRQQIASGTYVPQLRPLNAQQLLKDRHRNNLIITTAEDVPRWVLLEAFLLLIIMGNAVSNAQMHGKPGGAMHLSILISSGYLMFALENEPGKNHKKGLALQKHCSFNPQQAARNGMGSAESTFLGLRMHAVSRIHIFLYAGMKEIDAATAIMGAHSSLEFKADMVTWCLSVFLYLISCFFSPGHLLIAMPAHSSARTNKASTWDGSDCS